MPFVTGGNSITNTSQILDGVIKNEDIASDAAIAASKIVTDDEAYEISWDGSSGIPSKNAVYDKIKTLVSVWSGASASQVSVTNTTTDTALATFSVPGGTLSTNKAIKMLIGISTYNHNNGGNSLNVLLKYGSTTIATATLAQPVTSISGNKGIIEAYIVANGSTSSQKGLVRFVCSSGKGEGAGELVVGIAKGMAAANGTATEDSTTAKDFTVSIQWSGANAGNSVVSEFAIAQGI